MARARKTASESTSTSAPGPNEAQLLTCPECGRTFTRPAALGAHRRQAHGVLGASAVARRAPARRASSRRSGAATRRRGRGAAIARGSVDRDALLQAVFPDGLPAREAVIRAANEWLNQAEELATMK